jgi:LPS-assembly protein
LARFGVAQRLRLEDQNVTINPATAGAVSGVSDILLGASVNLTERWVVDSTVQYNGRTDQSVRSVLGVRYNPSSYRVLNLAYRFQRDLSEQVDASWQWPLNDLWGDAGENLGAGQGLGEGRYYALGRMNYSLRDGRLVDSVLGLEYDAGCWIGRLVMERVQTSAETANQRLMFQLEFVGFTRIGLSPEKTLTTNISHYQNLRDSSAAGSANRKYD